MNAQPIPADIAAHAEILTDQYRHIEDDREFAARIIMADRAGRPATAQCGLTPAQRELLQFIESYITDKGYSPSFAEIAEGIGLKSKAPVHDMVQRLADRGYLSFTPGKARSIVILHRQPHVSSAHSFMAEA